MGSLGNLEALQKAERHAQQLSPETIDISNWHLFQGDTIWPYFKRLRDEDPVCYHPETRYGPFWSITRHADIMRVDTDHQNFSSAQGITVVTESDDFRLPSFIAMDPPKHDTQRRVVAPVVGPGNLQKLEETIRGRVINILDSLPLRTEFDWVSRVSIELTTQMLATLLGFPFEQRYKLTRWSDVATSSVQSGVIESYDQREEELRECLAVFNELRESRRNSDDFDMISMLMRNPETAEMPDMEFLGNLVLLIVGGNDTTRNSISGGVYALNRFPGEYDKLCADHSLIPNMVAEIIRWQTPLTHMRRQALNDAEVGGKTIHAGDRVIMWYVSGNRDESVFTDPDKLIIDRHNARSHVSFGYGIHRCMGNRLAELQLRVLWEEIMKRFRRIEALAEPKRTLSNFVKGYTELPVKIEPL